MKKLLLIPVILAALILAMSTYTVDETEQVVITRFGKPIKSVYDAGLHFKLPLFDTAVTFDSRLLPWDGDPENMPTRDKKRIFADTFALWRISDPMLFYTSVRTLQGGQKKLDDLVDPAVRNVVTRHDLIEAVRTTDEPLTFADAAISKENEARRTHVKYGRAGLEAEILTAVRASGLSEFGITVEYVGFKRVNYTGSVREKVYDRMRAERERIAKLMVSEANEEANVIRGNKEYELEAITAEQNREVAKIRGNADAAAIATWREAIESSPDFYSFLRTMEALRELPAGSKLVLSTDSEFLRPLKGESK